MPLLLAVTVAVTGAVTGDVPVSVSVTDAFAAALPVYTSVLSFVTKSVGTPESFVMLSIVVAVVSR